MNSAGRLDGLFHLQLETMGFPLFKFFVSRDPIKMKYPGGESNNCTKDRGWMAAMNSFGDEKAND